MAVNEEIMAGNNKTLKVVKEKPSKKSKKVKNKAAKKQPIIENGWIVEEIEPTPAKIVKNIDDIFNAQEDKIKRKLNRKLKSLSKHAKRLTKTKKSVKKSKAEKDELQNLKDLTFKSDVKRPIIDEELNQDELNKPNDINDKLTSASSVITADGNISEVEKKQDVTLQTDTIDPKNVATVILKQQLKNLVAFNDSIGDVDMDDEDEDDAQTAQQMTISQAFEDDDITADFSKDKTKDAELKNTEIQLSMPGWGSWAGAGISEERSNKNKRLVLKLAKEEKRRDDNKNGLYINEAASKQLRTHLVSDIPFPFTSLQDYEASIRAPIGRNFVPETAFRMLTRPEVITRKGKVIEAMDESELVKPPRRLRHVVDKRIARAQAAAVKSK